MCDHELTYVMGASTEAVKNAICPNVCTGGRFPTNVAPKAGPPHIGCRVLEQQPLLTGGQQLKLRLDSLDAPDFWLELTVVVPAPIQHVRLMSQQ